MKARFKRQLAKGDVVLFTGAGFSHDVIAKDGRPVPQVRDLSEDFWRLGFPGSPFEATSSIGDLFDLAVSKAHNRTKELFNERLRVDASATPERFDDWFAMPWKRHYTLNIDNLDDVVNQRVKLPRPIKAIDAQARTIAQGSELLSVHLNGRVRDFPNVTFSVRQYGARGGVPDPWYELLVSDLLTSPVLFIGTGLDEPGLWQHIELRATRQAGDVELRPASYLVSPNLPKARGALLRRYNVDWIEATEKEFFDDVIADAASEAALGVQAIQRMHHPATGTSTLVPIQKLLEPLPDASLRNFLRGREPTFADVGSDGYAIVREFESDLARGLQDDDRRILVFTGTAASGKSTSAMRLALTSHAEGLKVVVHDPVHGSVSGTAVSRAARTLRPEVVLVNDIDVFGEGAGALLETLATLPGIRRVIATVRSSRVDSLALDEQLDPESWLEIVTPALVDSDIDLLLESLARAGSLGQMTGMSIADRRRLLREQAGRQLVVGVYYATSGEQLEDRVHSECEDLAGAARLAYGMAAWATAEHQYMSRQELLIGVGSGGYSLRGNSVMNDIENLVRRQLLIHDADGYRVRHRWIADETLRFFSDNGLMKHVVQGVAFAFAASSDPQVSRNSRQRRLLRRAINHDRLQRQVQRVDECREIYSSLQDRLGWDFHYWLQRGSLEVECGDLADAKTYLDSARSLLKDRDWMVENEYAYLMLKRASKSPSSPTSRQDAEAALLDLEEAMRVRGKQEAYPYHVYGSQGLRWARRARITQQERKLLVGRLLEAVREGRELHPKREELRQLESDLEREYLTLAIS